MKPKKPPIGSIVTMYRLAKRPPTAPIEKTMGPIEPDALYKAQEAADLLRCGLTNIYDLWISGQLTVVNVGAGKKGKRVRGSDIIDFINYRTSGGPPKRQNYKYLTALNEKD